MFDLSNSVGIDHREIAINSTMAWLLCSEVTKKSIENSTALSLVLPLPPSLFLERGRDLADLASQSE